MPLPNPKEDETKDGFISRCIEDEKSKEEFPNLTQRIAVCVSQWDRKDEIQKEKKPYGNEINYDHALEFTQQEMDELHENGVLYVTQTDEDGTKMVIKFIYQKTNNE
jgi:hypothetical protein